jgi:hypothetical protein
MGVDEKKTPENQAADIKKKTEALQATHDYATLADQLANPQSVKEMQAKQIHDAEEARKAAEDRERTLRDEEKVRIQQEKDAADQAAAEEKAKRETVEQQLRDQNTQMLLEKLNELKAQQKPWPEQLKEFLSYGEDLAVKLGFQKSTALQPKSEDPHIALELAKLELEGAREDRKFQLELEKSKREWDLQMLEFKRTGDLKQQELNLQEKRNAQIFSLPEVIGGAIAKGLIDREGAGVATPAARVPAPSYHIQAGAGEGGSFECPGCHGAIGVGPTTTQATCVQCNKTFPVVRGVSAVSAEPQPPQEEE